MIAQVCQERAIPTVLSAPAQSDGCKLIFGERRLRPALDFTQAIVAKRTDPNRSVRCREQSLRLVRSVIQKAPQQRLLFGRSVHVDILSRQSRVTQLRLRAVALEVQEAGAGPTIVATVQTAECVRDPRHYQVG
ncbi:hypothetical protein ACFB49_30950 [Sphingomonas sp. DBB INV C78]|uniref:hypothetical protein n=1 Tax=Sphingomonas sp. DBB INV C78 TaxID=3349434 RepID=UPI0036D24A7C